MITINLLSTKKKAAKKLTVLQQQMILGILILVAVVGGMWYFWNLQATTIADLKQKKSAAEARLAEQKKILDAVKNIEDERKKVQEKIDIIEKLKSSQSGPVHLLDEISKALPTNVNLTTLTESSNNISIDGEAFSNDDIVRFVENLKSSPYLTGVTLLETSQKKQEGTDVYSYKLQFVYKGL